MNLLATQPSGRLGNVHSVCAAKRHQLQVSEDGDNHVMPDATNTAVKTE
jgi:hypothetical protein